jgi:hypothetical protein
MSGKAIVALLPILAIAFGCAAAPSGSAGPSAAATPARSSSAAPVPVSIVTSVDFSSQPFNGTFEVKRGAEALGCSGGTFVDAENALEGIDKSITCTKGGSGSFTVRARTMTLGCSGKPETCLGSWMVSDGTQSGVFVGLAGFGEFQVTFAEGNNTAVETLSGEISYR